MRRNSTMSGATAVLLGLGAYVAAPSLAQARQASSPAAEPSTSIAEVIVTARRTEENLQDVPLTVTAMSPKILAERAVNDVYALQMATPSLQVQGTQSEGRASGSYVIHGQKAAGDDAPPGVVAYLNEVPVFGAEIARSFFDINNVQVLKGPQGTLFGRNTNGGAILFESVAPSAHFEGYATGRIGNLNERYGEAAINIPLSDKVSLRAAGNIERRDGFTKNTEGADLDNLNYENARISLRVQPNDVVDNKLVVNYSHSNERGPAYILSDLAPCSSPPAMSCIFPAATSQFAAQQALGIRKVALSTPGYIEIKAYGVSNTTTFQLDNLTIKNVFGYHDAKFQGHDDYDGIDSTGLTVEYARHAKQLSEELQVQGSLLDDRLRLIGGAFYLDTSEDPFKGRTAMGGTSVGYVDFPAFFVNPQYTHREETSKALFAQASYKLTDTLTVTGGYRYTWDETELHDSQYRVFFPGTVLLPFTPPATGFSACSLLAAPISPGVTVDTTNCMRSASAKFAAGNYIASMDWKPTEGVLLYTSFRHGYKSGGFNSTSSYSGPGLIFQPEKLNDLEVGFKTQHRFGDVDVRFNGSGFHDWYDGLQLTNVVVDPTAGPQSLTQTIGKAKLWGGEGELIVIPVRNLTLNATVSYFDGKFTQGTIIGTNNMPVNLAGVRYNSQPKFTYTLNASYGLDTDFGRLTPSVFYSWRQGFYFTYEKSPGNFISSYGLLNARIDLANVAGSNVNLALYGKNLTNKAYAQTVNLGQAFGYLSRFYGEPRIFGLEATVKF